MAMGHFDPVQGFCMRSWKKTLGQVSCYKVENALECRPVWM